VQTTHSVQDNGLEVEVTIAGASAAVAQQLVAGSAPIGSVSTTQVVEAVLGGAPLVQILKTGFLEGVRWLYQPANKDRALELLEASTNTKPAEAGHTYEQYMRERLFSTTGRYERNEFAQVVTMLVDTKQIPGPAMDEAMFFDDRYVDRAARALGLRR